MDSKTNPVQPGHDNQHIAKDSLVIHVTNIDLAICLISVGIPLRDDPPFTHIRLLNGEERFIFNFHSASEDGTENTGKLIQAFREDAKFISENPTHPFTFAMCALKNRERFREVLSKSKPWVAFRNSRGGKANLLVVEGSRKHQQCIRKGMVRTDPYRKDK